MPVVRHRLTSAVLAGNPLGDPIERDLYVYLPPGYDPARPYPALLAIVGFGGTGGGLFNVDALTEPLDRRLDRLIAAGTCKPVIVAAPDCFTRIGGNQYINSAGTGRYEDYLVDEIIPFVESTYRTLGRGRWGVFGKSSGGYGSIVLGMRRPEAFCAIADHSGDSNFELNYLPLFPAALDAFPCSPMALTCGTCSRTISPSKRRKTIPNRTLRRTTPRSSTSRRAQPPMARHVGFLQMSGRRRCGHGSNADVPMFLRTPSKNLRSQLTRRVRRLTASSFRSRNS